VLVPVGRGGLIGGIAAHFLGSIRVIGVEPVGAPTLIYARARSEPIDTPLTPSDHHRAGRGSRSRRALMPMCDHSGLGGLTPTATLQLRG
jgi:hypothetical protein